MMNRLILFIKVNTIDYISKYYLLKFQQLKYNLNLKYKISLSNQLYKKMI